LSENDGIKIVTATNGTFFRSEKEAADRKSGEFQHGCDRTGSVKSDEMDG